MSLFVSKCLLGLVIAFLPSSLFCQSLFPYLKDGLYGFVDNTGIIVVEPIYESVSLFGSDEMMVNDVKKKNYYNTNKPWPSGLALAYKDSRYYLVGNNCKLLSEQGTKEPATRWAAKIKI